MLRPERMSRVSVTGTDRVMDDVIDAVHELDLLHVTEYDGSWSGFSPGDPIEGADEASDKLVTVRALESILDVDESDAGPTRRIDDEALETELEEIRTEVNDLDDRRDEIEDELRAVEEAIDAMEPFVDLGLPIDLLSGYENLAVRVGQGDAGAVEAAMADAGVQRYETYTGDDVVAVFAYTDEATLQDAVVDARFTTVEIPDFAAIDVDVSSNADPADYVDQLGRRREQLQSRLETVEKEIQDVRYDVGGFLLAAEEQLSIDVQKQEAPLTFATTENAFVAEGWIPTDRYDDFEDALRSAVGDHVEIEELERADYDQDGHVTDHQEVDHDGEDDETVAAGTATVGAAGASADEDAASSDSGDDEVTSEETAADGGVVTTGSDEPPVIMDNPLAANPFELLVETVERPRYGEFDPTVIIWLTFPAFYGFMIGDLGYGILYTAIGWILWSRFDSDGIRSLGGIAMWAGAFTILFGIAYGEIFGLHVLGDLYNGPLIHKGISPDYSNYATAWLVVATMVGLLHMTIGYVLDFFTKLRESTREALLGSAAWAALFVGIWIWIFSTSAGGMKPDFLFGAFNGDPLPLGFAGFSPEIGLAGLGLGVLGFLGVAADEIIHEGGAGIIIAFLEGVVGALANVLSYTRLAAVLLAKAGMALTVNLLFFGAFVTGDGGDRVYHFALGHMPEVGSTYHGHEVTSIMFPGLSKMGIAALVFGIVVLVIGHALVLALGVTSAGLQAVRLEYVEFMTKFYEGGGEKYDPFGYVRKYTTGD